VLLEREFVGSNFILRTHYPSNSSAIKESLMEKFDHVNEPLSQIFDIGVG
jgi:hypothetical protein